MSKKIRWILATVLVIVVVAGGLYFAFGRGGNAPEDEEETAVATLPSDGGGSEQPTEEPTTEPTEEQSATGDFTDPEQLALAFANTYPGDVDHLADPTFLASLDGTDASLLSQISNPRVEQVDHDLGDVDERYAFTVFGTYQGSEVQAYSITLSRPAEPEEGGSDADNDVEFRVDSFDWGPDLTGDEDSPGPAADLISPLTAQQRGDLMTETRQGAITQVLTHDPEESDEQRAERLSQYLAEPTDVTPPMSRSGRYAMKVEILSQAYSTEPGKPITLEYTGTWVDPYDATNNGSWSLTATVARDDDGELSVQSVTETPPSEDNGHDE